MIQKLHNDNIRLYKELDRQVNIIDKAEKYEKERKLILAENNNLKQKCSNMECSYNKKIEQLENNLEMKYRNKIEDLEYKNNFLTKIINTLEKTIEKFISWICHKFSVPSEDEFIRDFQKETNTFINAEKQIEYEEWQKENEIEY